ncbi:MAG: hypothetical protein J6336_10525 [Kiritimatiellae bacterium]|nr:hypothetical protein [Kiritimatiellia bacterium]
MTKRATCILTILFSLAATGTKAEMKPAPIFSSHMVFAAGRPIRIHGTGEGKALAVFNGKRAEAVAANGNWSLELPAEPYGGPYTLDLTLDGRTVTFEDIYVGEVYLLAGQSNMQFKLGESDTAKERYEDLPLMRSFSLPRPEPEPHTPADGWVPCTKNDAGNWSAIGYHFGRTLQAKKGIAIGLINAYQGASIIQSWMPAALANQPAFVLPKEELHFDATHAYFSKWNRPGILYEKAFRLIGTYPVSGVLWYQGESNTGKGEYAVYADLLAAMIGQWRKDLLHPDLPFAVIQIADYDHRKDAAWKAIQAAQLRVPERCPHVTAVKCADICSSGNIHPPEKEALGKRLAAWALALFPKQGSERVFHIAPDGRDCSAAFFSAIDAIRRLGGGTIELEKGDYHFGVGMGREMAFFISNHDQSPIHPVNLPFSDVSDLTVQGNGAHLIFHGATLGAAILRANRVTLKNLTMDWSRPFLSEMTITGFEAGKTLGTIDKTLFPYWVDNGHILAVGEGWTSPVSSSMLFRGSTHEIVERSCDVAYFGTVEAERPDGTLVCPYDFSKVGAGAQVGDIVCLRPERRPYPAIVIDHAKDTVLENIAIHTAWGMGVIAQMSENIIWRGTGKALDGQSGCSPPPGSKRVTTLHADASHFSNVKGEVTVENCLFETMMDDAINVHSTCLGITAVEDNRRIRCRYMHGQAYGFDVFNLRDTLRFIRGKTLENGPECQVAGIVRHDDRELTLTLSAPIPDGFGVGDAVENADYQPSVIFRGNVVRNNRARGALFTTPRSVLVEDNDFDHVSGSAILFAGDAQGWYESGACEQVTVRGNRFRNCLTSVFQFCNGILSAYPMIRDQNSQKRHYHRHFTITGNRFETFDVPLLYALSTDEIIFEGNTVIWNTDYRGWKKPPFILERCDACRLQKVEK